MSNKDGDRAIHLAVNNGDSEILKLLVDHGADFNSPNYKRSTPLTVACKNQDWQTVNLLLDLNVSKCARVIYMSVPFLFSFVMHGA